jgi:hypothetical protein
LWLYIYRRENWEIKTNNKETREIFEKKWEKEEAVCQLLVDIKRACDSVKGGNPVKYSN